MDVERKFRRELVDYLSDFGEIFEEVELRHAIFEGEKVRADVLAFLRSGENEICFAFEVKKPTPQWEFSHWNRAIKQAQDYCFATIDDPKVGHTRQGKRVRAAFLYPWFHVLQNDFLRKGDEEILRGAFLFSQHMQVGGALEEKGGLSLLLGTDRVWTSKEGLKNKGELRLGSKIRIGSTTKVVNL